MRNLLSIIGILIISNQLFSQSTEKIDMPKQYLKVHHQDGLIFYEEFRIADILLIPINDTTYRLDADIKTYDGPYSQPEIKGIEKRIGEKICNQYKYAWLSLQHLEVNLKTVEEIDEIQFEIEDSFDDDLGISYCTIYFGWSIELRKNKIYFSREDGELFLNWSAESEDMNYYNHQAKPTYYEMKIKVNIVQLEEEGDLNLRWKKLANMSDRYYEILRNMQGKPMKGLDLPVHEKVEGEIGMEESIKAWELVPEIMEKYPKDKKY